MRVEEGGTWDNKKIQELRRHDDTATKLYVIKLKNKGDKNGKS